MSVALPSAELIRRYDVPGPRYTSYPPAPAWSTEFGRDSYARQLELGSDASGRSPIALYVHVPFCRRLCTYCGCNVTVSRSSSRADRYIEAVGSELRTVRRHLGLRASISQVHWGGGSPTFLSAAQLRKLWGHIASTFDVLPDAERSIEANPVTTAPEQLQALRELGFNRLSIGVQDFDERIQRTINRYQTVAQTRLVCDEARRLGFEGINFDLVYGLPYQTAESWERTLQTLLELRPDRVACFAFAYLPQALPNQRKLPADRMPRGSEKLQLMLRAYEALLAAGYVAVGMDHFALAADPLAQAQAVGRLSRGFQGYTVEAAPDVIGVGVSAISDFAGAYAQNTKDLERYEELALGGLLATERGLKLSSDDLRRRRIIQDIMCRFEASVSGEAFASELESLAPMVADNLVRIEGGHVTLTEAGRWLVRNAAMAFDGYQRRSGAVRFSQTV